MSEVVLDEFFGKGGDYFIFVEKVKGRVENWQWIVLKSLQRWGIYFNVVIV